VNKVDALVLGDTVSKKFPGIGRHEGIVTGYNRITARSRKYNGVSAVTVAEFTNGCEESINNHGHIGVFSRRETVLRATSREGEIGYDLLSNHCINFVNEVSGLPKNSRMTGIILTIGLGAMIAYALVQAKPQLSVPA